MKTVNTNRLNQFWNEGVLPLVDELTGKIEAVLNKIDVLDTKEEIQANTDEEKIAGALAVKEMFGEVNSKLNWKKAGLITDHAILSFPETAKEFQITCAHGSFINIIPFNSLITSEHAGRKIATSFVLYIDDGFHELYFSFIITINGTGIYVDKVTRDQAIITDYACNLFYQ